MLLQEFTHLLWVSATALSLPFWKRSRRIGVVQMRFSSGIKSCDQATDSKRSDSSLLSVLLFGFCYKFWDVFDWGTVIVILVLDFLSWSLLLWALILFFLFTEWLILSIFGGFLRLVFTRISSCYNSFLFRLRSIKLIFSFQVFDLIFLLLFPYFL